MKKIVVCAFALSLIATVAGAQGTTPTTGGLVADAAVPTVPLGTVGVTGIFTTAGGLTFGFLAGTLVLLVASGGSSSATTTN
jgi:hypothetical protein